LCCMSLPESGRFAGKDIGKLWQFCGDSA
jgi:hypothetical protein